MRDEEGIAPEFVTPLKDKQVKVSGIVKLTVVLNQCKPSAHIHWFKDGKDITQDGEEGFNLEY